MEIEVRHDPRQRRFFAVLPAGGEAHIDYFEVAGGTVNYAHTYVDPAVRERGVARELARHALEHARGQGWKVIPGCSYIRAYLQRHPEFRDVVAS